MCLSAWISQDDKAILRAGADARHIVAILGPNGGEHEGRVHIAVGIKDVFQDSLHPTNLNAVQVWSELPVLAVDAVADGALALKHPLAAVGGSIRLVETFLSRSD